MCFQIHLGLKDIRLVCLTFSIQTDKVGFSKVFLEFLVVEVILRISATIPPVTDMTSFVLLPTMSVEFVVTIKALFAKSAFRMTFEAGLVDCTWIVIAKSFVLAEFGVREKLVLMGKDFLVPSTKITHHLFVRFDMAMEIRPTQASHVTIFIGTVISQEKNGVLEDDILFILDTQVLIDLDEIGVGKFLKPLLGIVGEYHKRGLCLEFHVSPILVKSRHRG